MVARKRFGQNFLHDPRVISRLIEVINPQPKDHIIEIGPGRGALTAGLLDNVDALQAIELDRDLIPVLEQRFTAQGKLHLLQADALKVDYLELAQGRAIRLVGNLPYNISSPLMFHLLASQANILDMHFMLQKEVVERLVATPGTRSYGRLTVAVAAQASAQLVMHVGPDAFTPAPKVDSAVVRLQPRSPDFEIADRTMFSRVVTQAFSQRRKTLRNALSGLISDEDFLACDIDAGLRAEMLSPAQFALLTNRLA